MVAEVKKRPILRHIITGVAVALCTLVVLAGLLIVHYASTTDTGASVRVQVVQRLVSIEVKAQP